jgi:RHS repeat-associated protein
MCASAGKFIHWLEAKCEMIHNDHLGTPQKMTDSSGTVVWAADYKPFGEVNITTNTNNLRFPGQYYDAETGLHQNWWREYYPAVGIYVESDRIGIRRGTNHLYTYANSNPLMLIDVTGSIPNFGGGFSWSGVGVIGAFGWSIDFEECCKGKTKYQRTLARGLVGPGLGTNYPQQTAGSFVSKLFKGASSKGAYIQIYGPSSECSDYSQPQKITCFSASWFIGVDVCDTGSGKLGDTLNINVGMGVALYTVFVKTFIVEEVAVGCCK